MSHQFALPTRGGSDKQQGLRSFAARLLKGFRRQRAAKASYRGPQPNSSITKCLKEVAGKTFFIIESFLMNVILLAQPKNYSPDSSFCLLKCEGSNHRKDKNEGCSRLNKTRPHQPASLACSLRIQPRLIVNFEPAKMGYRSFQAL